MKTFMVLFLVIPLAGCIAPEKPLPPPIFSVDEIRYWWEGDILVVNVTIRNQVEINAGVGLSPELRVFAREFPGGSVDLMLTGTSRCAWEQRYYSEPAQRFLGITSPPCLGHAGNSSSFSFGPILIRPNQTVTAEFGLLDPENSSESTYRNVWVMAVAKAADREDAKYLSGCFNRTTPEFYGVQPDGVECKYWDCSGDLTETSKRYLSLRPKPEYIASCTATNATGPYYD